MEGKIINVKILLTPDLITMKIEVEVLQKIINNYQLIFFYFLSKQAVQNSEPTITCINGRVLNSVELHS